MNQKSQHPYSIAEMEDLLQRAWPEDDFITKPVLGVEDDMIMAPNVAALLILLRKKMQNFLDRIDDNLWLLD